MLYAWLVAGTVLCAVQAIRAKRLLLAALWLAGVSALVSLILYEMGARQVAVIELSVGAGLVTVLFVFAISIAGDDAMDARELLPKPLALGLILFFVAILAWMILPIDEQNVSIDEESFSTILWSDRGLDVLVQTVLIFSGVLCVLGLLSDIKTPAKTQLHTGAQPLATSGNGQGPAASDDIVEEQAAEKVHS